MTIRTVSEDFQLPNYFPSHLHYSLGGPSLELWPSLNTLLLIRSDRTTSSRTENETNQVTLCNEHTVFPIPALLQETGTISSLALLGSLANLHCKVRSNTLLWNLKKNTTGEDIRNHHRPLSDHFSDLTPSTASGQAVSHTVWWRSIPKTTICRSHK